MNIWRIEPFEIPGTDRTAPPRQIVGIGISYFAGKVAVMDDAYSPITLVIDYYDAQGIKREYLQDRIDDQTIRSKAVQLEIPEEAVAEFVKGSMDKIVKSFVGGQTIEERHATLSELAAMFGQVLLPVEAQTGTIN